MSMSVSLSIFMFMQHEPEREHEHGHEYEHEYEHLHEKEKNFKTTFNTFTISPSFTRKTRYHERYRITKLTRVGGGGSTSLILAGLYSMQRTPQTQI
jgi:hypothetical protein